MFKVYLGVGQVFWDDVFKQIFLPNIKAKPFKMYEAKIFEAKKVYFYFRAIMGQITYLNITNFISYVELRKRFYNKSQQSS